MFNNFPYLIFIAFFLPNLVNADRYKRGAEHPFGLSADQHPLLHRFGVGRCPVVHTMKNFNMSAIYGKWYTIADYTEPNTDGERCRSMTFSVNDADGGVPCQAGPVKAVFEYIDTKTGQRVTDKPYHIFDSGDEDKPCYTIKYPDGPSRNWWVIATDYDNYLATYACTEFPDDDTLPFRFYIQHSWIMHCKPDGVFNNPDLITKSFTELGIDVGTFVSSDTNCELPPQKEDKVDRRY